MKNKASIRSIFDILQILKLMSEDHPLIGVIQSIDDWSFYKMFIQDLFSISDFKRVRAYQIINNPIVINKVMMASHPQDGFATQNSMETLIETSQQQPYEKVDVLEEYIDPARKILITKEEFANQHRCPEQGEAVPGDFSSQDLENLCQVIQNQSIELSLKISAYEQICETVLQISHCQAEGSIEALLQDSFKQLEKQTQQIDLAENKNLQIVLVTKII